MKQAYFQERRQRLMATLDAKSIVVLKSSPEYYRNGDTHYPYRPQSDFYYLTGFTEPNAFLVLIPEGKAGRSILFVRENNPLEEQWEGARAGIAGALSEFAADEAYPITQLHERLPELLANKERIYYLFSDMSLGQELQTAVLNLKKLVRGGVSVPSEMKDLAETLHEMRLIKDEYEIACLRKAASISAHAHRVAMERCKVGLNEYQLQAILEYEFSANACRALAYPSIVAGGNNACVLHYSANTAELKNNDLVLVDAGGEYQYYAADITRTYPVNGKFTAEQRAIYELVLKVQEAIIAAIRPGVRRDVMQAQSEEWISEGLISLGLLKGRLQDVLASRSFTQFYMHRIGHWLGLDVHDVGAYKVQNEWRELKPGMVLTIEPGIYISPELDVDPRWKGIGVRIEDDILVTEEGCENLSIAAPKQINEIERL